MILNQNETNKIIEEINKLMKQVENTNENLTTNLKNRENTIIAECLKQSITIKQEINTELIKSFAEFRKEMRNEIIDINSKLDNLISITGRLAKRFEEKKK